MNSDQARERLYTVLAGIPPGRVITYGQLADLAGLPRRARWVGQILSRLPAATTLPWHRVINAQGKISLSSTAAEEQKARLQAEGVSVSDRMTVSLKIFGWN